MRICLLTEALMDDSGGVINGAQVQISQIGQEMRRRGHEVVIVTGGPFRSREREHLGMPVHRFHSSRFAPLLGFYSAYRTVRSLEADIVYVRGRSFLAGVAAAAQARSSTAFVWASNGEDGCERWKALTRLWRGTRSRSLGRRIVRTPVDFVDDLVADTGVHRARAYVSQTRHQRERLWAVHGRRGVVIGTMHAAPKPTPQRLEPPMVLWIGRVAPDRHPEAFVEVASRMADASCSFVLVGPAPNGGYLETVLRPAAGLQGFQFVGPVSFAESWRWIARASILVNTASVEGMSNGLVQAWCCGTPVAVLRCDPDDLIQKHGLGLRGGSIAGLEQAIRALLGDSDLRQEIGRREIALADEVFSPRVVGAAYEDVFRQALSSEQGIRGPAFAVEAENRHWRRRG